MQLWGGQAATISTNFLFPTLLRHSFSSTFTVFMHKKISTDNVLRVGARPRSSTYIHKEYYLMALNVSRSSVINDIFEDLKWQECDFSFCFFVIIILYELPCSKRNVNSFLTNTNEAVLCKCTWNAGWGVCKTSFNSFFKAREDEKWDFRLCFKSYVIFLHLFLFPSTCWIIFYTYPRMSKFPLFSGESEIVRSDHIPFQPAELQDLERAQKASSSSGWGTHK